MKINLKEKPRLSGKTTRLLLKAIKKHLQGVGVYVIVKDTRAKERFKQRLLEFVPPENLITVATQYEIYALHYNLKNEKLILVDDYAEWKSDNFSNVMSTARNWNIDVKGFTS